MWPFTRKNNTGGDSTGGRYPDLLVTPSVTSRPDYKFADYCKYAYAANSAAYSCIRLVARSIAALPIKVYREQGGDEVLLNEHPVWDLLRRPYMHRFQSWEKFITGVVSFRYLNGNVYHLIGGILGMPKEITLLRPDLVTVKLTRDKQAISHYEYRAGGNYRKLEPEKIFHYATFNPLNDIYGEPVLNAASWGLDLDNYSAEWNVSILKNMARPSIFLKSPEHAPMLSPQQLKILTDTWNEKFAGSKKAGKVIAIGGGYEPKIISWNAKDLDWLRGMISAQIRIAIVCGVPPELIGIQGQKTYSNYHEARMAFYQETVIPEAKLYLSELTTFLNYWYEDDFIIGVDVEQVDAIAEDTNNKSERVREELKYGLYTINEARQALGRPAVDGGDVILVGANQLPLDAIAGMSETEPVTAEAEEEEEGE